jgi:succinate dehydrogenase / fumarate reductase, cytochrome b subunit
MDALEKKYFVHYSLRRLHSVVGLVALGLFLCEHFFTNSFAIKGPEAFNLKVEFLTSLPYLVLIEIVTLAIPFLFHTLYGLVIIFEGSVNLNRNNYGRNWAYVAQRVTAVMVMIFLIFHVGSLRFYHKAHAEQMGFFQFLSGEYFSNPAILAFYIVGIAATFFHLANGICTFCMTWGLTIGPRSQRIMAGLASLVGLAFMGAGLGALYGFIRVTDFVHHAVAMLF